MPHPYGTGSCGHGRSGRLGGGAAVVQRTGRHVPFQQKRDSNAKENEHPNKARLDGNDPCIEEQKQDPGNQKE